MSRSKSGRLVCDLHSDPTKNPPEWDFIRAQSSKGGTCEHPDCDRKVYPGETVFLMDTGERFRERDYSRT